MNFAMIIDGCLQTSYYVKDKKSYKFNTDEPYQHHHSIGNECHLGLWGYPFLFDGYFLNWTEFEELPTLDLDLILVAIEKKPNLYNVSMLRQKYPNATIVGFVKESHWIHSSIEQRISFFKDCDFVTYPWNIKYDIEGGINGIGTLSEACGKKVSYLPYPHDIEYLYKKYYTQYRDKKILAYKATDDRGQSTNFTSKMGEKYGFDVYQHIVKWTGPGHQQWEEFLSGINSAMYCFNLSDRVYGGTMGVQCAALGILNVGGIEDSHKLLWSDTYTNEETILEHEFLYTIVNQSRYNDVIENAYNKAIGNYSHDAVRKRLLGIVK